MICFCVSFNFYSGDYFDEFVVLFNFSICIESLLFTLEQVARNIGLDVNSDNFFTRTNTHTQ